ncbi:MAG TPA: DNA polymerase subunit beta [Methanoregulaceae archaeon]|nr:DNA polymerase subunit beta [Methanoregulaceae archaeon]
MVQARLRDFIQDRDGWLYAVSTYDNADRIGCILRYIPDPSGERVDRAGRRYRKLDFEPAFRLIEREKPDYLDIVHRVPVDDVVRLLKPDVELPVIIGRDPRVKILADLFPVPVTSMGCTGSLLCGLEIDSSDIDFVVYGKDWFIARDALRLAVRRGLLEPMSDTLWQRIYEKRQPDIGLDEFIAHEERKWNRGRLGDTYFDLLYTRSYNDIVKPAVRGEVLGPLTIEAVVTDSTYSFDNPAVYTVDHPEISCVLSFTHTYSGQAEQGEVIEARGVCEQHGEEQWLIVGTTREAHGEYILSKTLLRC